MDVSYDNAPLQVEVPVRVFSARCNQLISVIFLDFCGKPAQITVPSEAQTSMSVHYEMYRGTLHALARSLESKGHFYTAPKYAMIALQIEDMLKDLMLDLAPPPTSNCDGFGVYPLDWFLTMGRRQFLLIEDKDGVVSVARQGPWPDPVPSLEDLPRMPGDLVAVSAASLRVAPLRCGKDRFTGSVVVDKSHFKMSTGARSYTVVCARDTSSLAASEGHHRALAWQIRQLEWIESIRRKMGPNERLTVCIPGILAYVYHDVKIDGKLDRLPVGAVYDELPGLVPLRSLAATPEMLRDWVLKICKTVEWLISRGIGWGGSVDCRDAHKGHALLDAVVVDAYGRPWLMEGFTNSKRWKFLSDKVAVQMLRLEYGLVGVEQLL